MTKLSTDENERSRAGATHGDILTSVARIEERLAAHVAATAVINEESKAHRKEIKTKIDGMETNIQGLKSTALQGRTLLGVLLTVGALAGWLISEFLKLGR